MRHLSAHLIQAGSQEATAWDQPETTGSLVEWWGDGQRKKPGSSPHTAPSWETQCPGPTRQTPSSCEVEGEVWSSPWRWYSATTECRQTKTEKPQENHHSQVADGTFTRDRNRMNTQTQWCKVSDYWVKSEFLIKIVCD